MDTILRTQRLLLRRAQAEDAPAMHAIMSDPVARRYWSTLPHAHLAESEAWIAGTIAALPGPAFRAARYWPAARLQPLPRSSADGP